MGAAEDPRRRATIDPEAALAALHAELAVLPGVQVRRGEPLGPHLPLRCGGPADIWAEVDDDDALRATLRAARSHGQSWHLAWPFEDRLVRDGGIRGLVVRPGRAFEACQLLPAEGPAPARLLLGAAAPWAAAGRLAHAGDSPCAELATWPSCPGATYAQVRDGLEGLLWAVNWTRGRSAERTELPHGIVPPEAPRTAVLLSVEIPLTWPAGTRRIRHRQRPAPLGTLFHPDESFDVGRQLRAAGVVGSRLRTWRMAWTEPGTLVALDRGDARSALLFAKGVAEHVRKVRGLELTQRLAVDGVDGSGPDSR